MLVVQGKNITRFEYMAASGFGLQITMCLQTCPSLSYELAKARARRKHETLSESNYVKLKDEVKDIFVEIDFRRII